MSLLTKIHVKIEKYRMKKKLFSIIGIMILSAVTAFTVCKWMTDEQKKEQTNIVLPEYIYAVDGHELNIYFDNLIEGRDIDYVFDVDCEIGSQYDDFFRVVPETGVCFLFQFMSIREAKWLLKPTQK